MPSPQTPLNNTTDFHISRTSWYYDWFITEILARRFIDAQINDSISIHAVTSKSLGLTQANGIPTKAQGTLAGALNNNIANSPGIHAISCLQNKNHFIALVIDSRNSNNIVIYYHDPLSNEMPKDVKEELSAWLQHSYPNQQPTIRANNTKVQDNAYDCGPYTIQFIEKLCVDLVKNPNKILNPDLYCQHIDNTDMAKRRAEDADYLKRQLASEGEGANDHRRLIISSDLSLPYAHNNSPSNSTVHKALSTPKSTVNSSQTKPDNDDKGLTIVIDRYQKVLQNAGCDVNTIIEPNLKLFALSSTELSKMVAEKYHQARARAEQNPDESLRAANIARINSNLDDVITRCHKPNYTEVQKRLKLIEVLVLRQLITQDKRTAYRDALLQELESLKTPSPSHSATPMFASTQQNSPSSSWLNWIPFIR